MFAMKRREWLRVLPALGLAAVARGDMAGNDPRLRQLFGKFIAPCCWRENLLVHHSPKADELRAEIRRWVAAGWTDERIQGELVRTYSKRILSLPEGTQGQALWWAPWIVAAGGVAAVVMVIQRSLRRQPAEGAGELATVPEVPDELE
jgi:cytochrome c-type biogenesis protein CcmH/NrfF